MVEDREVVRTAADAAENVIFSRCDRSAVDDLDITVTFEEGVLEVDVYLDVADDRIDDQQLADDAALAARAAVDELFA
ncbi:DUF3194 domain-containing protein [Halapricum desulfuricans]|uniref:DUF3194 domain-containing protein n=1 Tax=Halapricum desulfuricans TaxID=2841257 RepID=A0A897NLT2_9EURY|nr:DUF3194 domain-containing protein [Halapricum desulfuricans]QSG08460.1 Uncharacterized protein HSR122_1058 [Halapricum desulfuricans]QSG12415.1 Uncharacterized protein HSBGL_2006 [Halapricum desulfuricans]